MAPRGQWGRHAEFMFTLVGYTVGYSNFLAFPHLLYRNGGAAFLIPYLVCQIFLGIPMVGLEIFLGQYVGKGPLSVWCINPVAKGVGFGLVALSGIFMLYHSVMIAWSVRYLIASFAYFLPWKECRSCSCALYNATSMLHMQGPCDDQVSGGQSPSAVYFREDILNIGKDITDTGTVQWQLMLCNLVVFALVFVVLCKGVRTLGKVAYVTTVLPLLLMTILLIRMSLLDGAGEGIRHYMKPNWDRLEDTAVWVDAVMHTLFSLGISSGGLIAMASYNKFNTRIIRDAFLVPIIDFLASLYAGFLAFAIIGHVADAKRTSVAAVAAGGPDLAFILFPEAVAQMPVSTLWAILFYIMMCLLGLSTQFTAVETFITAFVDQALDFFSVGRRALVFRAGTCVGAFLLAMPIVTRSGAYLVETIERGLFGIPACNSALFEMLIVGVIYGVDKFMEDVQCMLGRQPGIYFKVCWMIISPLILVGGSIYRIFAYRPHPVPLTNLMFWLVSVFPLFTIPAYALIHVCKASQLSQATTEWLNLRSRGSGLTTDTKNSNNNPEDALVGGGDDDFDLKTPPAAVTEGKQPLNPRSEDGIVNGGFHEELSPSVTAKPLDGNASHDFHMTRL